MLKLSIVFLILTSGCVSPPKATKFDGKWTIVEFVPGEKSACLPQKDVYKLREILIRCSDCE